MRCVVEWAAPPGALEGESSASVRVLDLSEDGTSLAPEIVCERAHGEKVKLTLDPSHSASSSPSLPQYRVRIASTARLAEVHEAASAALSYVATALGAPLPPATDNDNGEEQSSAAFYALEVVVQGRTELRLAGIKGAFRLARIEAARVAVDGECSAQQQHQQRPTTQARQMADLVALAQSSALLGGGDVQQQQVPKGLQELYGRLSAAPESAQAAAVKQLAAALARGVMVGGGGGGIGGSAAAKATAATTTTTEEDRRRRHEGEGGPELPPPQHESSALALALVEAAIQRSEARVLAAIDALAARVGALEAAVTRAR